MTTLKGQIIDKASGEPIQLHGFIYFGFDDGNTCVDGLYAGTTTLSRDLATVIRTQQALGFNAVRLLTSFGNIFGLPPVPQSRSCTSVSPADYQAYLTDPAVPVAAGATIPELAVRVSVLPPFPCKTQPHTSPQPLLRTHHPCFALYEVNSSPLSPYLGLSNLIACHLLVCIP